jgi:hypothetical protein
MEDAQQRFATADERRHFLSAQLDDFLVGNNALCVKLGLQPRRRGEAQRRVRLCLAPDDRQALLNRLVREPSRERIVSLTSALLTSGCEQWQQRLTPPEQQMQAEWEKSKAVAMLEIHFRAFLPPWREGWAAFYEEFSAHLLLGAGNQRNLQEALAKDLPLEFTYTVYRGEVIRQHVLEPLPWDAEGPKILVRRNTQ